MPQGSARPHQQPTNRGPLSLLFNKGQAQMLALPSCHSEAVCVYKTQEKLNEFNAGIANATKTQV